MTRRTYGQALGELIYQRRKGLGLTQTQLAVDAYGTAGKTRRISELENGLVANPHPKTVDPVIVVLGIKEVELEECARVAKAKPDPALDAAYLEARELIDNIAKEFEISLPGATLAEIDAYLRGKAKEWFALRSRIRDIESIDIQVSELMGGANDALSAGNFVLVDKLLSQAEEVQQVSNTIREVEKQAKIRIARADACLLNGERDLAASFYIKSAEYFIPFDEVRSINLMQEISRNLYEVSKMIFQPHYLVAAKVLERALLMPVAVSDSAIAGGIRYRISLMYRSEFAHYMGAGNEELLDIAAENSRSAIKCLSDTDDLFTLYSAKIALANCLYDKGRHLLDAEHIKMAISILKEIRRDVLEFEDGEHLLPSASNSLSACYITLMDIEEGLSEENILEVIGILKDAISSSERSFDIDGWSAAHINYGRVLFELSKIYKEIPGKSYFVRMRAISALQAAREASAEAPYPIRSGEIGRILGDVLVEHALGADEDLFEFNLFRARSFYQDAINIYKQEEYENEWAWIKFRLGRVFALHAQIDKGKYFEKDIEAATECFSDAKAAFDKLGASDGSLKCAGALKAISSIMARGGEPGDGSSVD
jgi:tetratricopeptide (TPR) repeat protein